MKPDTPWQPRPEARTRPGRDDFKKWWQMREDGMNPPDIARTVGLDTRTVKRGLARLSAEDDERGLRRELKKEALASHFADLLQFAGKLREMAASGGVPRLGPTHAVFEPHGGWLRPPGMKLDWSGGARPEAVVPSESGPAWKMFRAHEKKPALWAAIDRWKAAAAGLAAAESQAARDIVKWLEAATGLAATADDRQDAHATLVGAHELFERCLDEAAGEAGRLTDAGQFLRVEGHGVWVGAVALVTGAGDPEGSLGRLREAWPLLKRPARLAELRAAVAAYRQAAAEAETGLAYVGAARYFGGQCRGCEVLRR